MALKPTIFPKGEKKKKYKQTHKFNKQNPTTLIS